MTILSLLGVASSVGQDVNDRGEPWKLHIIDDSSEGADGVRLADVNDDGFLDIATGWEEGGRIGICINPGPEKVKQRWTSVTVGRVAKPEDAVFVDLDADGAMDVVSSCEVRSKTVWVHWAPEDPDEYLEEEKWETEAIPALKGLKYWMFCLPLQVDGKNGIDLVMGSKGIGTGLEGDAQIGWLEAPNEPRDLAGWKWRPIYDGGWIMSLVGADMDGDGDTDILTSNRKGPDRGCLWLENPGEGEDQKRFWKSHRVDSGNREVLFLSYADVDRDGLSDVVTATKDGGIMFYRRTSPSGNDWEEVEIPLPPETGTGKGVYVADIDLDGDQDIAFTCEHSEGKSGALWFSHRQSPSDPNWRAHEISGKLRGIKYDRIEMEDLDGDGDLDLLTCEENDNLGVIWYENPTR